MPSVLPNGIDGALSEDEAAPIDLEAAAAATLTAPGSSAGGADDASHASEPAPMQLLVLGECVTVRVTERSLDESQAGVPRVEALRFDLHCRRELSEGEALEWSVAKSARDVFTFSRSISKLVKDAPLLREPWCGSGRELALESVELLLDTVYSEKAWGSLSFAQIEQGFHSLQQRRQGAAGQRLLEVDSELAAFIELSAASIVQRRFGKTSEGWLHKAPVYYHDELELMNGIMLVQAVLGGTAAAAAVLLWSPWPLVGGLLITLQLLLLHVYIARPEEPGRTAMVPLCLLPGLGQAIVALWLLYDYVLRANQRRWCVFRPGYIAYFASIYDTEPRGVFAVDRHTHVRNPWWSLCNPFVLQIVNQDQRVSLHTKSLAASRHWRRVVETRCALPTPPRRTLPRAPSRRSLASSAPPPPRRDYFLRRQRCPAQWYADARLLYCDMLEAFKSAEHEIFIAGWMISPELRLLRDGSPEAEQSALEDVLGAAVQRGVKVCVLLYRDVEIALPNNSRHAKARLQARGVQIVRHAAMSRVTSAHTHLIGLGAGDVWWSHHEKLVVVDQALAFVGGIDLAFGRFDDLEHRLTDPDAATWPGKDFYNVRIREFEHLEDPHSDLLNRATDARMPWHDIHCAVGGSTAQDVAQHFVARWNRELRQGRSRHTRKKAEYSFLLPASWTGADELPRRLLPYVAAETQVLRSVGPWSLSRATDRSITRRYLEMIREAERFIYVENQFFNSQDVADALANRLWRALEKGEEFRVVVVLPQWPAFEGMPFDNPQTKIILKYQHKCMDTILDRVRAHPSVGSEDEVRKRVAFYSLRAAQMIAGKACSEQVYVHSKLLIVDDARCIIGSANLNKRSLRGDRDSEVCLYLDAPRLAHDLRAALYIEHLGLHASCPGGCRQCSLERRSASCSLHAAAHDLVRDPLTPLWDATADANTALLEEVFPGLQPRDEYRTIKHAKAGFRLLPTAQADPAAPKVLAKLRGNLVRTPLGFLRDEKRLLPAVTECSTYLLPRATFG